MTTQRSYQDNSVRTWNAQQYFKDEVLFEEDAYFKKGPWFDVKAYGATGDGTTVDYAAILLAVTAAGTNPYRSIVFFPNGRYNIGTNNLSVPNGVTLLGVGVTASGTTYYGSIISCTGTGCLTLDGVSHVAVRNMGLINGSTANISITGSCQELIFDNLYLYGGGGDLILGSGTLIDVVFRDIHGQGTYTRTANLDCSTCNGVTFDHVYSGGTTVGYYLAPSANGHVNFRQCIIESSDGNGITAQPDASAVLQVNVFGCYFESNADYDIDVNPSGNTCTCLVTAVGTFHSGNADTINAIRSNAKTSALNVIGMYTTGLTGSSIALGDLSARTGQVNIRGCFLSGTPYISATNPTLFNTETDFVWPS